MIQKTKTGKAFTLIELLVVVAIISLLVSILLPSLNKAKDMAKLVVCASNLRAIGQAEIIYTNSYNGYYTPLYKIYGEDGRAAPPYNDDSRQTAKWDLNGYYPGATTTGGPFPISAGLLTSDSRTSIPCEGVLDGDAYDCNRMPKVFFDPSRKTMPDDHSWMHYEAVWTQGSVLNASTVLNNRPMFVCPIGSPGYNLVAGPHATHANALYPDAHVKAWGVETYEGEPGAPTDWNWSEIFYE